jgi:phosphoketolase
MRNATAATVFDDGFKSISAELMTTSNPLSPDLLNKMHAYWRAANYLSVGQIYLQDNPLLETPLTLEHIKPRLLGHWGPRRIPASVLKVAITP